VSVRKYRYWKETVFLIILAFFFLFPFGIVVLTSFRTQQDVVSGGVFALPNSLRWDNFPEAWRIGKFRVYYRNSLLVTLIKVPTGIFVAALAAYPLAKYRFRIRDSLFAFFLLGLGIPINIVLLPLTILLYRFRIRDSLFAFFLLGLGIPINIVLLPLTILLKRIGLLNTLGALFFPYIVFGLPFQILVLRGFFRGIPDELIDAARIDGCAEFQTFWRIILPLATPAVLALFIIDFLATWNELLMALIFIHSDEWKTVPLGLMYFQGQFASSYPIINAGVLIAILPVLGVYILLQRYFVSGITAGALKE